jgi:diguanylate cyclase (GGDEF)-like protein
MPASAGSPDPAPPFVDFDDACAGVLAYLHTRFGRGLWMVTRTAGTDEIVLRIHDEHGPHEGRGQTVRWAQITAGAYAAVPLELADGRIFGSLCAVDPDSALEPFAHEMPAIAMYARLLATILARELEAEAEARRAARAEDAALTDALTGLPNRRAWDLALAAEEDRCRRYGAPAAVLSSDIDGLKRVNDELGHSTGDELLKRAAAVMTQSVRRHDLVARIGGDEFAVLLPECTDPETRGLADRMGEHLRANDVVASIGCAQRTADDGGLVAAFERADAQMYAAKRRRSGD